MMRTNIWLAGLLLLSQFAFCQSEYCEENATGVYWPVKIGIKRFYNSLSGSTNEYFNGDSMKVGDKVYFKQIVEDYKKNTRTTYIREQEGNVYIYDEEKKLEFLELSGNITPGFTWEKYDGSWKYTIMDTSGKYFTPYCEFKGLLNIKAEPIGATATSYSDYYNLYYKRGVGLVGLEVSGKMYSYLTLDKSKFEEKDFMAAGCETLKTNFERTNCTHEKIHEYLSHNFSYSGDLQKGSMSVRFEIDEEGNVKNAVVVKPMEDAVKQTAETLRLIKTMKFIPRTINGKAIKSTILLPVNF